MPNSSLNSPAADRRLPDSRESRRRRANSAAGEAAFFCERLSPLWPLTCFAAIALACLFSGCRPGADVASEVKIELEFSPAPPVVGTADVVVKLTDPADRPVAGAEVRLEGNMNHAGMKPVFSDLMETETGRYEGTLEFTMGGDWFVLVTGRTPDGGRLDNQIDVKGVKRE